MYIKALADFMIEYHCAYTAFASTKSWGHPGLVIHHDVSILKRVSHHHLPHVMMPCHGLTISVESLQDEEDDLMTL